MKHEGKALSVKVDIRRRMHEKKCEDDSAVKNHLDELMHMQAQLESMGTGIPDDELVTIILGSLPKSYRPFISAISMSAKMSKLPLGPKDVVETLIEEYDHLAIDENKMSHTDSAMAAKRGGKGKGDGKTKKWHKDAKCFNCDEIGHISRNCPKPRKKEKDGKKGKGKSKANVATELSNVDFTFTTTFSGSVLSKHESSLMDIDVYDSAASNHMSPSKHRFVTLKETPPHPIKAADKTIFKATGIGSMKISIPNGNGMDDVTLNNVLYSPDLAFTLISLS
jgi:hypothetical protein